MRDPTQTDHNFSSQPSKLRGWMASTLFSERFWREWRLWRKLSQLEVNQENLPLLSELQILENCPQTKSFITTQYNKINLMKCCEHFIPSMWNSETLHSSQIFVSFVIKLHFRFICWCFYLCINWFFFCERRSVCEHIPNRLIAGT